MRRLVESSSPQAVRPQASTESSGIDRASGLRLHAAQGRPSRLVKTVHDRRVSRRGPPIGLRLAAQQAESYIVMNNVKAILPGGVRPARLVLLLLLLLFLVYLSASSVWTTRESWLVPSPGAINLASIPGGPRRIDLFFLPVFDAQRDRNGGEDAATPGSSHSQEWQVSSLLLRPMNRNSSRRDKRGATYQAGINVP